MGRHLLEVLIPAVISALLLGEGVQGKHSTYSLKASSPVSVQLGLHVNIPCTFTYDPAHDDPHAKLYGYWYVEDHLRRPGLVATNNPEKTNYIDHHIRRRFEVSGPNLTRGDCSLTIMDVEMADQAFYHFRMEKGHSAKYSYSAAEEKVSVIVTGINPRLSISELLRAGNKTSITCVAPRSSLSDPPTITWSGFREDSRLEITPRTSRNTVESIVNFTLEASDHLRNVTCKATYVRGSRNVTGEMTVTLSVDYSPRKLQFSGHLTRPNGEIQNFTNFSQITPREGDSLVVYCEADGNPQSFTSWRLRFPAIQQLRLDKELKFPNLNLEDQRKYVCEASNSEGDAKDSLNLQVLYSPRKIRFSGHLTRPNGDVQTFTDISQITPREGDSLVVHCKADGNPQSSVSWKPRVLATRHVIFHHELRLPKLKLADQGKYVCEAINTEGHAEYSFNLRIHSWFYNYDDVL